MTVSKWRYNLSSLPLSHYKEAVGSCLKTRIENIISGAIDQSQMNVTASFFFFFFWSFVKERCLVLKIIFHVLKETYLIKRKSAGVSDEVSGFLAHG